MNDEAVRLDASSLTNGNRSEADGPSPEPDPQLTSTPCEDMEAAEDAEQGLVARRRNKRAVKIRVRRKR